MTVRKPLVNVSGQLQELPSGDSLSGQIPAGGATGQVLAKASSTDGDVAWSDGVTADNTVTLTNKTLVAPVITDYTETAYVPAASTAFTVNLANGTLQKLTTSGNCTITLPSPVAGKSYTIQVAYGGAHTLTWAGGGTIKWPAGTAPSATSVSGKVDTFTFYCVDGTNTFGASGGANA